LFAEASDIDNELSIMTSDASLLLGCAKAFAEKRLAITTKIGARFFILIQIKWLIRLGTHG
jgi:hypothetical protein